MQESCQFLTTNQLTFLPQVRSTNTNQSPVRLTVLHSYPAPHALSHHNYDYPQTRYTKNQVHFSLSPIQCRPTSNYTSSQSLSVPTSSSRQYHNHQNQNHVTNLSNPLSPHTTESVEIDHPPPSDEISLSHYQYPQSKQFKKSKQYEYRRRSCPV